MKVQTSSQSVKALLLAVTTIIASVGLSNATVGNVALEPSEGVAAGTQVEPGALGPEQLALPPIPSEMLDLSMWIEGEFGDNSRFGGVEISLDRKNLYVWW